MSASARLPNPFIPLEIVEEIAEFLYASATPPFSARIESLEDLGVSTKPRWSKLASFSNVSKAYRYIVLDIWFRSLRVTSSSDLSVGSRMFPALSRQWARYLHCTLNPPDNSKPFDLKTFRRLKLLRLDRMGFSSRAAHRWTDGLGVVSPFQLFKNVPVSILEAHVNGMLVPSPSMFKGIHAFENLKILRLRERRIWCDLCNLTCLLFLERPFPKSIIYENGGGLSIHYRKSLSCLKQLELVSITTNIYEANGLVLGESESSNSIAWSGECDHCVRSVLSDEDFRQPWVALKKGEIEEMEGFGRRKYLHHKVPSLKRVEWYFVDSPVVPEEEGVDEDLENTER